MQNTDEKKPSPQTTQTNPLLSVQTSKPATENRNFEIDNNRKNNHQ